MNGVPLCVHDRQAALINTPDADVFTRLERGIPDPHDEPAAPLGAYLPHCDERAQQLTLRMRVKGELVSVFGVHLLQDLMVAFHCQVADEEVIIDRHRIQWPLPVGAICHEDRQHHGDHGHCSEVHVVAQQPSRRHHAGWTDGLASMALQQTSMKKISDWYDRSVRVRDMMTTPTINS